VQPPAVITCTDEMAEEQPELVVAFMKGMIKVGRWCKRSTRATRGSGDPRQGNILPGFEDTYRNIMNVDMVPNLSPQNLAAIEIGKDFMLSHGYINKRLRCEEVGRAAILDRQRKNCSKNNGRR